MGSELGLDLKLSTARSVAGFLSDVAAAVGGDGTAGADRLECYLQRLDDEKRKIEAFRRELPLSVLLVSDVIRGLRDELERCRGPPPSTAATAAAAALEEFMPMKDKFESEGGLKPEMDTRDKMNWMSSAQLWSDNSSDNHNSRNSSDDDNAKRKPEERGEEADCQHESKNLSTEWKARSGCAFLPFKKEEKRVAVVPDLCIVPRSLVTDVHGTSRCAGPGVKAAGRAVDEELGLQAQHQTSRKARRCWSPELHRRFVFALQQLGGAQVATPKQIRELMKVDGLTNDEVKSHLQKYRLHTRKMPNTSPTADRPVMVVGGLWAPQDHYSTSQQSALQSGSPQGPLQLASSAGAISVTAGDSYEEEDGKSESYSWK